jgi:two-component system chemotaxis response regulator CheY
LKKVLCVDDSATVMTTIEMALKDMVEDGSIHLVIECNPKNILSNIDDYLDIDFIFCDINMPEMHGLSFVKELRSIKGFERVPVMMLTTEVADHLKDTAKEIGVRGWITKPFSARKLQSAIKQLLRI